MKVNVVKESYKFLRRSIAGLLVRPCKNISKCLCVMLLENNFLVLITSLVCCILQIKFECWRTSVCQCLTSLIPFRSTAFPELNISFLIACALIIPTCCILVKSTHLLKTLLCSPFLHDMFFFKQTPPHIPT